LLRSMRADPMKLHGPTFTVCSLTSRSKCGDPVCRPIRLSLSTWPALLTAGTQPLELCSGRSGQRGTLISGRFRAGKLVGSGQYSKSFFAGVQCSGLMPFSDNEGARHTI
jgi:hypothetical protein